MSDITTSAQLGVLSSSAENFAIVAGTIRKELDELQTQLQSKLTEWEGDAQQAYWKYKAQWDAAAADMQAVVQRLGLAIGTAHDNYVQAEKYGVNLFD
ncbi:WXG100 family type VII secretion target [Actinoallomurus sp. NPDC052274]|uniref:WXG100 family type VII secretion target n=1 Tax=Actinoallomurus sp. NPDC052274 TaxID=3155420 RepID=UPI003417DE8F